MCVQIDLSTDLQRVLWACFTYWRGIDQPPEARGICYQWVLRRYQQRFDGAFHQQQLRVLARLGFLHPDDTSRGGSRRYYQLADPEGVETQLREWGLVK